MPSTFQTNRRQLLLSASGAAVCAAFAMPGAANASTWPSRQIRIVVPFAPGGASDAIARILSLQLGKRLGQPVIIENKPGAATIIGVDTVAKAPADGYTLLLAGVGSFSVLPALRKKLPFEVERDLAFLALAVYSPNVLVTAAHKTYRTLPDLVAAAKKQPNVIRYATYGDGSANHLCGELLARAAGIQIEGIPYKGAGDAKLALLRGDVDLSFETLASAGPDLQGGRLRALAHGGAGRTRLLPDLPGLSEFGYGSAAVQPYFGLALPAATPAAIKERIAKETLEILALPEFRDAAAAAYMEVAALNGEEMRQTVARSTEQFRRIAQELKLSLD